MLVVEEEQKAERIELRMEVDDGDAVAAVALAGKRRRLSTAMDKVLGISLAS